MSNKRRATDTPRDVVNPVGGVVLEMYRLFARTTYPSGVKIIPRSGNTRCPCNPVVCSFESLPIDNLVVCKHHLYVHRCEGGAGTSGCEFALKTRETLVCPATARTWPLEFDIFAQRLTQRLDGDMACDGDDDDACVGGETSGEEDGSEPDTCAQQPEGDNSLVAKRVAVQNAADASRSVTNSEAQAQRPTRTAAALEMDDAQAVQSVMMTEVSFNSQWFNCQRIARETVQIVVDGRVRRHINRKKTEKSMDLFNMAVRRYMQRAEKEGMPINMYMLMCVYGSSYPDLSRYSGTLLTPLETKDICDEIVSLWLRLGAVSSMRNTSPAVYTFGYHCMVVLTHMRTGYSVDGKEIIKHRPCAHIVPTPREMHMIGFIERRITTHTAIFAKACTLLKDT